MDKIKTIIDFVEGKISPKEFEQDLYNDSTYETILDDRNEVQLIQYITVNTYYFVIEQNFDDPGGILNVHGALCQFLDRRNVAYQATNEYSELFDLILNVQPKYLDINTVFFKKHLLDKAPELSKPELKKWLKEQIKKLFIYVDKPPKWIQSPQ